MSFFFTSYPERTIIWLTISTWKWLTIAKTENYVVVIGEKDNRGIHSKDHNWVDLTVCVGGTVLDVLVWEVVRGHDQHERLLLHGGQCIPPPNWPPSPASWNKDGHRGQWLYSDQIYSSPLHQQDKEIVYNPWRMQVEPSKV